MFNTCKKGHPVCRIVGGVDDDEIIYIDDKINTDDKKNSKFKKNYFKDLEVKDGILQHVPDTTKERECGIITGASGSGKSYYVNNYISEYKKNYKKNDVYFFSVLDEDKSINKNKIKRVRINEDLIKEPITIDDLKNSLVICDDIEMIRDKPLKNELFTMINSILMTGRHTNTSLLLTVHNCNTSNTRLFLNECSFFVYFPFSTNKQVNYVLEHYLGIDKKEIKYIKSLKSRSCTVFKNYPQCILTEHNLFSLSDKDIN